MLLEVRWKYIHIFSPSVFWTFILCSATDHLTDARGYCTPMSSWLYPYYCLVRCLWWCHTDDRRALSHLDKCKHHIHFMYLSPEIMRWNRNDVMMISPAHMTRTTTMMMSSPALSWGFCSTSSMVTSSVNHNHHIQTISHKIYIFFYLRF